MGNLLSFSVTESELLRVKIFLFAGQHLDPRGAPDAITIIVISLLYFFNLLAVIYMLWNRKYPPLKSKNPLLMAFMFCSSVLWFTGDIQVNGHVPLRGTPLVHCKAVGVWVHVLLGVCIMASLIAQRSYGLYRVFVLKRPYRGLALYIPLMITAVCLVAYGVVTQLLPEDISVYYMPIPDLCFFGPQYRATLISLVWVIWLIVAVINWLIRDINCSFNETREIMIACGIVFCVLIAQTVLTYVVPLYVLSAKLRVLTTSLNHFGALSVWWLMMAVPLYKCLTDRQQYLDEWFRKLRQDGQQQAYRFEAGTIGGTMNGDTTLRGDFSYVNNNKDQAEHRLTVFVPAEGQDTGNAKHSGDSGVNDDGIYACQPTSPVHSHNSDGGAPHNASATNLISHPQPQPAVSSLGNTMSPAALAASNILSSSNSFSKPTSEHAPVRRLAPPPPVPPKTQGPVRRQWDRLNNQAQFGVPSFTSSPMPPVPSSSMPMSSSPSGLPYSPLINFPEPVAIPPLRLNIARDAQLDDPFNPDKRRLI
ncbi:hypothetical protein H4R26_000637 [Coemansia thaxteri]|uniref:G-protein coupled receptors family 3 profile domain-containing protein n=1 Tax=Coemansia thaxteri TaxID=2663907 RepID=A0A9W8BMA7_9FUNG|nr:hypothetical protein H4R26_000637 [Coemansia thaxteri]